MKKLKHRNRWQSLIACVVILFFSPLSLLGSQTKLSIKEHETTLVGVIKLIEKNSDYTFFYNASDLKNNKLKDVNLEGSVEDILNNLFSEIGVDYVVKGNEVILKIRKDGTTQQKKRTITGTVLEAGTKEPVIGANVWLKNSSTGTVTDIDGKYSITVETLGGVLEFSYIGMNKQDVAINNRSQIDVILEVSAEALDEVVVVGYGTQKKESVVGAISTVDISKLKVPGSSMSNVLAGQLAGVVSMTRSGEPGKSSASDFYIRGVSSFKGKTTPLVLVDGIERELDLVDTDDIASFSILKDASASAVYGVRGANGVILITTKKGVEGKPRINVRTEAGITSPTRFPKMLDSPRWAELYNEAA